MRIDGATQNADLKITADAVVIGSGAGGAVIAAELAEAGARVVVLEEGAHFPTSTHHDLAFEAIQRMYRNRGFTMTLGKPSILVPLGKALGGTTAINSGTCFRTPSEIFRLWNQELGLTELREEVFKPLFEELENFLHVSPANVGVMSRANTLMREIAEKKRLPGRPLLRNTKNCEGCGFCCYGCTSGAKRSMELSFLPRAAAAGATIITRARAEAILTSRKQATGVCASFCNTLGKRSGHKLEVSAPIVIVAAGTMHSPVLLARSGIARRNRHLGRNLTLHPATKVFARFDREDVRGWEGIPQAYLLEHMKKDGVTFEGIFAPPDVAAITVPLLGRELHRFMRDFRHMAAFGFLINDAGSGRVVELPLLGPTMLYSLQPEDVRRFQMAVIHLAELFLDHGATEVYSLIHGHTVLRSREDIDRLGRAHVRAVDIDAMAFHPLGTCRMATGPDRGVVGADNAVFGWKGVYVADGSVVPTPLGVNPQLTIMALAKRLGMRLANRGR